MVWTIIIKIEATVNRRPLTSISTNSHDVKHSCPPTVDKTIHRDNWKMGRIASVTIADGHARRVLIRKVDKDCGMR